MNHVAQTKHPRDKELFYQSEGRSKKSVTGPKKCGKFDLKAQACEFPSTTMNCNMINIPCFLTLSLTHTLLMILGTWLWSHVYRGERIRSRGRVVPVNSTCDLVIFPQRTTTKVKQNQFHVRSNVWKHFKAAERKKKNLILIWFHRWILRSAADPASRGSFLKIHFSDAKCVKRPDGPAEPENPRRRIVFSFNPCLLHFRGWFLFSTWKQRNVGERRGGRVWKLCGWGTRSLVLQRGPHGGGTQPAASQSTSSLPLHTVAAWRRAFQPPPPQPHDSHSS